LRPKYIKISEKDKFQF